MVVIGAGDVDGCLSQIGLQTLQKTKLSLHARSHISQYSLRSLVGGGGAGVVEGRLSQNGLQTKQNGSLC